jgi:hypothetical protein
MSCAMARLSGLSRRWPGGSPSHRSRAGRASPGKTGSPSLCDPMPHGMGLRETVQQQQGGAVAASPGETRQAQPHRGESPCTSRTSKRANQSVVPVGWVVADMACIAVPVSSDDAKSHDI